MSRMLNPLHPGETLREDVLPALGLSLPKRQQSLASPVLRYPEC